MNKQIRRLLLLIIGLALESSEVTMAQAAGSDTSSSKVASSGENAKVGDYVWLRVPAPIFTTVPAPGVTPPKNPDACAPTDSIFEIDKLDPSSDKKSNTFTVDFKKNVYFKLHRQPGVGPQPRDSKGNAYKCADDGHGKAIATVQPDTMYTLIDTDLGKYNSNRLGWTWGGLLIPYKFEFKDRSFKGQPSTVAYVGYEGWIPGLSFASVLALGPGIASSSTTTNTQSSSGATQSSTSNSTNVTYTAAIGGIFTFGALGSTPIKAGILLGKDYQGSGSGFKYENRTWMALSIGASFN